MGVILGRLSSLNVFVCLLLLPLIDLFHNENTIKMTLYELTYFVYINFCFFFRKEDNKILMGS